MCQWIPSKNFNNHECKENSRVRDRHLAVHGQLQPLRELRAQRGLAEADRPHAALLARLAQLAQVEPPDALPVDGAVVLADLADREPQLVAQVPVAAEDRHVLAHVPAQLHELRAVHVVDRELVVEQRRERHDAVQRQLLAAARHLDELEQLLRAHLEKARGSLRTLLSSIRHF